MSEHWAMPEVINEGTPDEYVMSGSHRMAHILGADCCVIGCCMCEYCWMEAEYRAQVIIAEDLVVLLNLPQPVPNVDFAADLLWVGPLTYEQSNPEIFWF